MASIVSVGSDALREIIRCMSHTWQDKVKLGCVQEKVQEVKGAEGDWEGTWCLSAFQWEGKYGLVWGRKICRCLSKKNRMWVTDLVSGRNRKGFSRRMRQAARETIDSPFMMRWGHLGVIVWAASEEAAFFWLHPILLWTWYVHTEAESVSKDRPKPHTVFSFFNFMVLGSDSCFISLSLPVSVWLCSDPRSVILNWVLQHPLECCSAQPMCGVKHSPPFLSESAPPLQHLTDQWHTWLCSSGDLPLPSSTPVLSTTILSAVLPVVGAWADAWTELLFSALLCPMACPSLPGPVGPRTDGSGCQHAWLQGAVLAVGAILMVSGHV